MMKVALPYRLLVIAVAAGFGLMTVVPGIAHACKSETMIDTEADVHDSHDSGESHDMHGDEPLKSDASDSHGSCCCEIVDSAYARTACSSSQTAPVVSISDGLCCLGTSEQLGTDSLLPPSVKALSVQEVSQLLARDLTGEVRIPNLPAAPVDSRPDVYLLCSSMRL